MPLGSRKRYARAWRRSRMARRLRPAGSRAVPKDMLGERALLCFTEVTPLGRCGIEGSWSLVGRVAGEMARMPLPDLMLTKTVEHRESRPPKRRVACCTGGRRR